MFQFNKYVFKPKDIHSSYNYFNSINYFFCPAIRMFPHYKTYDCKKTSEPKTIFKKNV